MYVCMYIYIYIYIYIRDCDGSSLKLLRERPIGFLPRLQKTSANSAGFKKHKNTVVEN